MKIYRIIINNFRSLKYLDFKPDRINLLIGRNNSGKTNILTALDYCLNPYRNWHEGIISEIDFYNRNIECSGVTFEKKEVTGINIEIWFDDFKEGEDVQNDWDYCTEYINENDELLDIENINNEKVKKILRVTFECGNDLRPHFYFTKPDLNRRRFTRAEKELVGFHFIPAYRDPLRELSFYQNSFFSKLLEKDALQEQIDKVVIDLNKSHEHLFNDSHFKTQFEKLRDGISKLKLIRNDSDALGLEVLGVSNRRILQNFGLVFQSDNCEKHIPLRYQGYGAQNAMLIITILQLINAQLEKNLIIAFEEPEQNLEPYFQRILIKKISELASRKNKNRSSQLLMTTHSRDVVEMFSLKDVKIVQVDKFKSKHNIHPIIEKTAKLEWNKFLNRIENRNKGEVINGFFAKSVLLVEGESEKGGLPVFSKYLMNGFEELGIEIIWCKGKGELPKYARYFKNLNMKVYSLCDNDESRSSLDEFNKIIKISDFTIRWSRNYEMALLSSKKLIENFFEICEEEYDWRHKQIYLENTFCAEKNGIPLNRKLFDLYHQKTNEIKNLHSLVELKNYLFKEGLLIEYLEIFLHQSFSSSRCARLIAENICKISSPPTAIHKLFYLIRKFENKELENLNVNELIKLKSVKIGKVISTLPLAAQID